MQSPAHLAMRCGLAAVLIAAFLGCRSSSWPADPEYAAVPCIASLDFVPDAAQHAMNPVLAELEGPHPVESYVAFAMTQNPRIQAARKIVEARANRVPQAASLEDPMVSVMGYPFTVLAPQYVNGRMTGGVGVSQKVPWIGKLRSQAEAAEAETNQARAQLAAAELETAEKVRRAYFELHYTDQAVKITERDRGLLVDLEKLAEARYRTNAASQQDVLRAQLEVASLDGDLIRMRQERDVARAALARLLHVSPDTRVETLPELLIESFPADLDRLYRDAITFRPELHAQLAMIERDEWMAEAARLNYYPDVTYNVAWEEMTKNGAMSAQADGIDMVQMGFMLNVPIYRQRLEAGVRQAEAQVVASAREYDALKDETLEEVKSLLVQARSQWELSRLFRETIVPKADQTLRISQRAYQVGQTDILQLVDNWRQLLRVQLSQMRAETQLRQSLASLERIVGGQLHTEPAPEVVPPPSAELPTPLPLPRATP